MMGFLRNLLLAVVLAGGASVALAQRPAPAAQPRDPNAVVEATPTPEAIGRGAARERGTPSGVKGISRITNVEGITEYRVDSNGFRFLLFPDPTKPTVTVNMTYLVGSRMENYGETGMAHLLEHMMFKGTPKHPHVDQEFNQRGARFNGSTTMDRTNYYEITRASPDNLAWALELESDRMVHSFIAKKDLDSEMTVVRNEYEMGENSPFEVLMKRLQSIMYDWHAYGRATIGNRSDIENVPIAHLQAFYRMYYQPDNAVLMVTGKFDEKQALDLVAKNFGPIAKPKRTLPVFWTVEPTQDGERTFTVRRKGDIDIVMVGYHVPSNLHDESDPIGFAGSILGTAPTGRLHKDLVEKGLASQVFSIPVMGVDPGIIIFGAVVKKGDQLEPVRQALVKDIEALGDNPPTPEEIERTRRLFANQAEKTLDNMESIGVEMSEYIALGDWRLFFLARDELPKITSERVAAAAKHYFVRDNRTVGLFIPDDHPQRATIPPAPTLEEVMKDFHPSAAVKAGEAFDPSQDNIDRRTKLLTVGDVKVALLPKKTRGGTVNVALSLHIGNEKALFGQQVNAMLAGQMLSRGTTRYTRAQLADEEQKLKMSGGVGGTAAAFQTNRDNLEAALRLAVHVLRNPAFPDSEWEQLVTQTETGIQASMSEPEALAADALSRHFNVYPKGDWRYSPSLQETLEAVKASKLDDAKAFWSRFYGASPAEIAIVGDFDSDAIVPVIRELLADWKPQVPYERVKVEYSDVAPTEESIKTPDKENAVFVARENIAIRDDSPDYPALTLADYLLGGGTGFDSRLATRIRQKEGLSYSVGSELSVDSQDVNGAWSVYAIAAPVNIPKVETAFREEMARALRDGFTEAEVTSAKSGLLQTRAQSRAQDATLAAGWAGNMHLGRTFERSKELEAKLSALTAAEVTAALRKYLDPKKMTVVKAGDFK
jgi:zinc protease